MIVRVIVFLLTVPAVASGFSAFAIAQTAQSNSVQQVADAQAARDGFHWTDAAWMRAGDPHPYRWTFSGWVRTDGTSMSDNPIHQFVLSIPQYLKWLKLDGQADSVMDKGAENTLQTAASQNDAVDPTHVMPAATYENAAKPTAPILHGSGQSAWNPLNNPPQQQQEAQPAAQPPEIKGSLQDVLNEIDASYKAKYGNTGFMSSTDNQARLAERAKAIQDWHRFGGGALEREQVREEYGLEKAKLTGQRY